MASEAEVKELVNVLSKGPKPVCKLPEKLRSVEFLASMAAENRIQFGRPGHCWLMAAGAKDDKGNLRGTDKLVGDKVLRLEGETSWASMDKDWQKSVFDLLAEDEKLDDSIKLHVRLTNKALAA